MELALVSQEDDDYTFELTWTPAQLGQYQIAFQAVNDGGGSLLYPFIVQVVPPVLATAPPQFVTEPPGPAVEGDLWAYSFDAVDPDGGVVTFDVDYPEYFNYSPSSRLLTWTPQTGDSAAIGTAPIRIKATDQTGAWTVQEIDLPVFTPAQVAYPAFDNLPTTPAYVGALYTYQAQGHDSTGGDDISWELVDNPFEPHDPSAAGATMTADGLLAWTPTAPGTYPLYIKVTDTNTLNWLIAGFYIDVEPPQLMNDPPEIRTETLGPFMKDRLFQFQLDVVDPNGHGIASIDVVPGDTTAPGDIDIDDATGVISWIPREAGDFVIAIAATDEFGATSEKTFAVHVLDNAPPRIQTDPIGPPLAGQAFDHDFTITDPNAGDSLTVALNPAAIAAGMSLLHTDGTDVWTLHWANPGPPSNYPVRITATDQRARTHQRRVHPTGLQHQRRSAANHHRPQCGHDPRRAPIQLPDPSEPIGQRASGIQFGDGRRLVVARGNHDHVRWFDPLDAQSQSNQPGHEPDRHRLRPRLHRYGDRSAESQRPDPF